MSGNAMKGLVQRGDTPLSMGLFNPFAVPPLFFQYTVDTHILYIHIHFPNRQTHHTRE